jgi:hypothetical protein
MMFSIGGVLSGADLAASLLALELLWISIPSPGKY